MAIKANCPHSTPKLKASSGQMVGMPGGKTACKKLEKPNPCTRPKAMTNQKCPRRMGPLLADHAWVAVIMAEMRMVKGMANST